MKPYQKIKQQRTYRKILAVVSLSALICVSSVYFAFWYETKDAQAQVMFPKVEKPEVMKLYTAEQAKQRIIEIANERNFKWTLYLVKLATCESRFNQFENQPNYNPKQNKCIKSVDRGFLTVPVVYTELSEQDEQELNLRLNKNVGEFDFEMLANIDIEMLKLVGFASKELDKIANNLILWGNQRG